VVRCGGGRGDALTGQWRRARPRHCLPAPGDAAGSVVFFSISSFLLFFLSFFSISSTFFL